MRLKERVELLQQEVERAGVERLQELEQEVRELLSEAKNTPMEKAAQELFAEVVKRNRPESRAAVAAAAATPEKEKPSAQGLIRRARIRIEMAGDEDDIDEAIDILAEALALYNENDDIVALLQQAASDNPQAAMRVRDLFNRYGVEAEAVPRPAEPPAQEAAPPQPPPAQPQQPVNQQPAPPQASSNAAPPATTSPPAEQQAPQQQAPPPQPPQQQASTPPPPQQAPAHQPPQAQEPPQREPTRPIPTDELDSTAPPPRYQPPQQQAPPQQPPQQQAPPQPPAYTQDMDDWMSELTENYYAGNYQQVVDIANRILSRDPNNSAAQDYRQKAEDNIIRGVVPDHRIPFEARVSYNRANSLVRAGNYEEAAKLYREARELAERDGVLNWKDVEQALLDIQDLALARELINEGDRLIATDNWAEAQRKYEGALRVVPNDPQAEERLEMIRGVQRTADSIAVELNMLGGTLEEQVEQLQRVRSKLSQVRQRLPSSERLGEMQQTVDTKLNGVRAQLNDQAQTAMERARSANSLEDQLNRLNEVVTLAEFAVDLDPGDSASASLLSEVRSSVAELQRAKQGIDRATALIAQNYDSELPQARALLAGMTEYSQDDRYKSAVNELFTRYLERAEVLIEEGKSREAQEWVDAMREEPFRILGRRSEVSRLEGRLRGRRNRARVMAGGIIGIILVGLGLGAFAAREPLAAALFPTDTPTSTVTATPSMTFTPSNTPTATSTLTPTLTFTPSLTPTWTSTATWTWTPSPTWTPSWTPTATLTATHTNTPTPTSTFTRTPTPTLTYTPTNTPSVTPTPAPICLAVVLNEQGARLREDPSTGSVQIGTVLPGTTIEIIGQLFGSDSQIWYDVRVTLDNGSQLFGFMRNDTVEVVQPVSGCPEIPAPAGD